MENYDRRIKNSVLFWSFFPCFIAIFIMLLSMIHWKTWYYTQRHLTLSTFIWCLMPRLLVFSSSGNVHWSFSWNTYFTWMTYSILSVSFYFPRKVMTSKMLESKPEVDGLPGVGRERSSAADLIICFLTSVQKLVWESFFFPLSATHSEYVI